MSIRVTVEIVPHDDEAKKHVVGSLRICNDRSGDEKVGNYEYLLQYITQHGECIKGFGCEGTLSNFKRSRGVWACIKEVLLKADLRDGEAADKSERRAYGNKNTTGATAGCAQGHSLAWCRLPNGLGYFWYQNAAIGLAPRPCLIRDTEDLMDNHYRELTFLRGVSREFYSFIKANPSGEFAPCVPPNAEARDGGDYGASD
jgi:hypothetical protein